MIIEKPGSCAITAPPADAEPDVPELPAAVVEPVVSLLPEEPVAPDEPASAVVEPEVSDEPVVDEEPEPDAEEPEPVVEFIAVELLEAALRPPR